MFAKTLDLFDIVVVWYYWVLSIKNKFLLMGLDEYTVYPSANFLITK